MQRNTEATGWEPAEAEESQGGKKGRERGGARRRGLRVPVGGAGQGDRQVARIARGRSREPRPEMPHGGSASAPAAACPFRQRDVSWADKGGWKRRIGAE